MNIAEASIKYKTITIVLTIIIIGGGILSYQKLGRLEDPEFTIKEAKIITYYPGATAMEVAEEVTDKIEIAVQQLGQLKLVDSISKPGWSSVHVEIKDKYDKNTLPQVWDELRKKIRDEESKLPPGTSKPIVYDDFGDVYGIFYAIYGDGYSYAELKKYAKLLRRELLLCDDVAKITLSGVQDEVVYIEISRARLSQLGISPNMIYKSLKGQNLVAPAGKVVVGQKYIRIYPTGEIKSVKQLGDLLILQDDKTNSKLYLKDIATIKRGYVDPPTPMVRFNGHPAIGLGISTVMGGNVITMAKSVDKKLKKLMSEIPVGIEIGTIAHQANAVNAAVSGFIINLVEAIIIVVAVLMIAMGLRSGILIGGILLLTILMTFILMRAENIPLQRISLGALIIALGMLVDNAIVIVEGILVNTQKGMSKIEAAASIVKQTQWPLFGATIVAVLAFAAIGLSQDSTGEYCRSLFQVMLFSLMCSWILAITVTPLLGVTFLGNSHNQNENNKSNTDNNGNASNDGNDGRDSNEGNEVRNNLNGNVDNGNESGRMGETGETSNRDGTENTHKSNSENEDNDPYNGAFFRLYRSFLVLCLRYRVITVIILAGLLGLSIYGFGFIEKSFFPDSTRPQFMIHYWLPEGTDIRVTERDIAKIEKYVMKLDGVTDVASFIGSGATRFLLTYSPEDPDEAYGMLLVGVKDYRLIPDLMKKITEHLKKEFPSAQAFCRRFMLGPGDANKIQARFRGEDPAVLRKLAAQAEAIMKAEPNAVDVNTDWRNMVPVIRPIIAETQARNAGLTRANICAALQATFTGTQIGIYREGDELLPIIARAPKKERSNVANIHDVQIWSPVAHKRIPISQFILGFKTLTENNIIRRRNRLPTLTVRCDAGSGPASVVFEKLRPKIEKIELPEGYELSWGGEYENSTDAKKALASKLPLTALLMVLIVIILFNSIRKPLIIFLTVPLAVIGVTAGLLLTHNPFGFMAMLGMLSLSGMLIKNAVVLIDEINSQLASGKRPYDAVVDSGVSRLRPVSMAALTTILGMAPLVPDAFFSAMAVAIMFGLAFATVLTLIVVPVLYTIFFRIDTKHV